MEGGIIIRMADAGETILALVLASPFYLILFSVIAVVVVWAFAAGLMALLGVVNFLTRPVQSILWLVKWVALIVASFGMLGGIVCLFFARYRIRGLEVCGAALLLFLLSLACEMGREKLEDMRQERVARRQERREMRRQVKRDNRLRAELGEQGWLEVKRMEMGDEAFEDWRRTQALADRLTAAGRRSGQEALESQAGGFDAPEDGRPVVDTTAADLE